MHPPVRCHLLGVDRSCCRGENYGPVLVEEFDVFRVGELTIAGDSPQILEYFTMHEQLKCLAAPHDGHDQGIVITQFRRSPQHTRNSPGEPNAWAFIGISTEEDDAFIFERSADGA